MGCANYGAFGEMYVLYYNYIAWICLKATDKRACKEKRELLNNCCLIFENTLNFLFHRNFNLYLTSNVEHFSATFKAIVVDGEGNEEEYPVQWENFFSGHVIGEYL